MKHTNCFVCHHSVIKPFKGYYEKVGLMKCPNCGFVFMERIPSSKELNDHYSGYSYGYNAYLSPITIKSFNQLLDEFEAFRKTNNMLDVGCGRGWFLQEAKKRGWQVYGTEYSEAALNICRKNGLTVIEGGLNPTFFKENSFDVITSFEVIEHINNPNDELKLIHQFLRKGGLFFCTTPNFNSILRYYLKTEYDVIGYPEHLSYYTKATLNRVVKQNGFKPVKFQSTGISITRFKTSKKIFYDRLSSKNTDDEKLREKIESRWYLGIIKKLINNLLTITNMGMTLKGFYLKQYD